MCSISGASFSPNSTINRAQAVAALVKAGEIRGRDAAGYAWVSPTDDGIYKKDVPGSKLHTGKIPQNASAFISHTRAATHGSPQDMRNNHPIESPYGTIRLVHNGVIHNHETARATLDEEVAAMLPDVDSSVIPAFIEMYGLDATEHLRGDATAAWFDTETGATIHLAKFNRNPISYAFVEDGSFFFASTPGILAAALKSLGLRWFGSYPSSFPEFAQSEYFQILDGNIIVEDEVGWDTTYSSAASRWRAVTDGHTTTGTSQSVSRESAYAPPATSVVKGTENAQPMVFSSLEQIEDEGEDAPKGRTIGDPEEEGDFWPYGDSRSTDDYDYWVANGHLPGEGPEDAESKEAVGIPNPFLALGTDYQFYSTAHDGDTLTYSTLNGLVQSLSWLAELSGADETLVGPDEGKVRWVNHIADIGVLGGEGHDNHSWVADQNEFATFQTFLPTYVHDGVSKLRLLVGA